MAITAELLKTLRSMHETHSAVKINHNPFETLIITIISQNTADTNTERAFQNLSERFEITPQTLANASIHIIEECLHVGGLYKNKAKTIQRVSKIILEKYQGSLNLILSKPTHQARQMLVDMPGVGPKTADVVLLFSANHPTIPVDTHVNRVSKRLGLVLANADYEGVRLGLQSLFEPKDFLAVHLLLIAHGRKYCKALWPLCTTCPLITFCPSKGLGEKT